MDWQSQTKNVAVQSISGDEITGAFFNGKGDSDPVDNGFTIANGLHVPKPYASKIILNVIRESSGTATSINDDKIEYVLNEIAKKEGMLIALEGATLWEAYKQLKDTNWITPEEKVWLLNTGNSYKYVEELKIY